MVRRYNVSVILVTNTGYNTKINKIWKKITDQNHDKYITTPEFDKLTSENFAARLKQANLASKSDIANFVNKTKKEKNEWNELSKQVKVISTKGIKKDLIDKFSIIDGEKSFILGIFQNDLVFIPTKKNTKYFHGNTQIYSWKSNEMSEKGIENITKSDSNFASTNVDHHSLPDINFNGHCLIKK